MSIALRITEIFYSLQGESNTTGYPTVFIRLTGCPLRCQYCDTAYAFTGGVIYDLDQVLKEVESYSASYVTVTGGEPLAQNSCLPLLTALCDKGYVVSLETSGAIDVQAVDPRVIKVMDLKTPGSGELSKNLESNIEALSSQDQVKFVICDRIDYEWAREKVQEFRLQEKVADVLFSPSNEQISATELAEWILADRLKVRFQIQLHKHLWGNKPGV
ncbi:MAG: 7-carboxy-7-deazaguanine synthase QueE [Pseudohongiellaceae bacterium]|jgi:7-carboxy-7-deazaguanine synthase